jgi:hypothetical protein
VAIVDFSFSPGSTTVHVGDSISWTNNGSAPHSATAHDGSFDTGILKKGQSGSHTFTHAGTVSYFCSVHPFMHGTVVVLASSSGSQTGGSQSTPASGGSGSGSQGSQNAPSTTSPSTTSTPSAPAAATSAGDSSLPLTGMSLTSALLVALSLLGGGLALRRLVSRQR